MDGKTRDFYDTHPLFNEKTRHSHKRLSTNSVKIALKYQLDSGTACHKLQRISTESHIDEQHMQKKTHKTRDWRQLGAKVNGKTRDFCEVRAILNEKTRHSHGRDSANPLKIHAKVTSYSENHVKMHTKQSAAPSNSRCG